MKLIALQRLSDQLPEGAAFDIPDHDVQSAQTLILAGLARKAEPHQPTESPQPVDPVTPARRTYRRRDLQADE